MKKDTRKQFNAYLGQMAEVNDVEDTSVQFNVVPAAVQGLQDKIVEQSTFLPKINIFTVPHAKGENVKAGIVGPASGRSNTANNERRTPKNALSTEGFGYELVQTNTDIALSYAKLDAWHHLGNLNGRIRGYTSAQIANDREIIGWYGVSVAKSSDIKANPLLQDVNKGWVQYMRDNRPANLLKEGANSGEIRFGTGGDYEGLDHAISDLVSVIPVFLRKNLVALIGDELVMDEKRRLYKAISLSPKEKTQATQALMSFGGVESWETPSNFPGRGLVITSLDNLSIYLQEDSWRRNLKEETEFDRWMDYNSRNEGYVVEEPRKFVGFEFDNVKLKDGDTWV